MKKVISLALSSAFLLGSVATLTACEQPDYVLKVCNWAEYIDEGGIDGYDYEMTGERAAPIYKRFTEWYKEQTGLNVKVEYSTFETNEELYNKMSLGDSYDLVCPSDYMIMKMAAEGMLETFDQSFYDTSVESNYYAQNLSPYIESVFSAKAIGSKNLSDYAAGYMWGTTGLIYNPEIVNEADLSTWAVLTNPKYKNKVTSKDNIRDSYFAALAIHHEKTLKQLASDYQSGALTYAQYNVEITELMNDTSDATIAAVEKILMDMKSNIYSFETDNGKEDFMTGKVTVNFCWSGDGLYTIDQLEEDDVIVNYCIPETASNLWFDGWSMPKGANKEIAQAFVNFLSMPENAIRNTYYIGYTSVLAGDEMFEYMKDTYSVEEGDEVELEYDLSYFFGADHFISTYADQAKRQLFAQYPTEETLARLAIMDYYEPETNNKLNNMWTNIKG